MKKFMTILLCAVMASVCMVGCDKEVTPETVKAVAYPVGLAAANVVKVTVKDADVQLKIVEITKTVEKTVPAPDATFEATWTPVAEELVQKYISEGKLSDDKAKLVLIGCTACFKGLDYLFTKNTKFKDNAELIEAGVHSFIDGFTVVLAPASGVLSAGKMDQDAYDFLIKEVK